jgi:hemerythrin superfamily protein
LLNEHRYLREHLAHFDQPDARRKFLRLLDAHDEKEEQVIYPAIGAHLGARAEAVLAAAINEPLPTQTCR